MTYSNLPVNLELATLNGNHALHSIVRDTTVDPVATVGQVKEPQFLPKFKPWSMTDLLAMPLKEWLIDQIIGAGDLAMVYGGPGTGKTFVIIDLIFVVCLGRQFAERFDVTRPLNVAYAAGEGGSGLPARFAAAADFHGITNLPNFTYFDTTPQLYTSDNAYATYRDFIYEWKQRQAVGLAQPLDILIIDTLHSATAGADENSSQHMGIVLQSAKLAAKELGCAVILVHHTNKGGSAERGSSSLRGAMDCMIEIRRISDNGIGTKAVMHCAKLKDGESWKDQTFDLVASGDSVRVWWDEPSIDGKGKGKEAQHKKMMLAFMTKNAGKKLTAKALGEVAGVGQSHANRMLASMVEAGECSRELMDTNSNSSNRNPLCYFVSSSSTS